LIVWFVLLDAMLLRTQLRRALIVASANTYQMPQLMPLSTAMQMTVVSAHLDVTLLQRVLRRARIVAPANTYQMPQLMPLSTSVQMTVVSAHLDVTLLLT
jgi:hypothetical protein